VAPHWSRIEEGPVRNARKKLKIQGGLKGIAAINLTYTKPF